MEGVALCQAGGADPVQKNWREHATRTQHKASGPETDAAPAPLTSPVGASTVKANLRPGGAADVGGVPPLSPPPASTMSG